MGKAKKKVKDKNETKLRKFLEQNGNVHIKQHSRPNRGV